jgi:hypothetical protein
LDDGGIATEADPHHLDESGSDGTEWSPPTAETSEEEMDIEDEVPDTTIKKKSGKKEKRGLIVRDQINKAAAELNIQVAGASESNSRSEVQKRKTGGPDESDESR